MSTIIEFPKVNIRSLGPEEKSLDEVQEKISHAKEEYVNALVDHHCSTLLANISLSGIEIEKDEFMKDFAFTVETVRSSMYRSVGLPHPLHEQIDEVMEIDDKDEDEEFGENTFPKIEYVDDDDDE